MVSASNELEVWWAYEQSKLREGDASTCEPLPKPAGRTALHLITRYKFSHSYESSGGVDSDESTNEMCTLGQTLCWSVAVFVRWALRLFL